LPGSLFHRSPQHGNFLPHRLSGSNTARGSIGILSYRPRCDVCRFPAVQALPADRAEGTPPEWLRDLLNAIDTQPVNRWTDSDIRALGLHPDRVRRWFQKNHSMTFHAYARARRLGSALAQIREGESVISAAFDNGYDSVSGFNDAFRNILGTNPT